MLKMRVVTAAIGIPIMLLLLYFGGMVLVIGIGVLSGLGIWELHRMLRLHQVEFFPFAALGWVWAFIWASAHPSWTLPVLTLGSVGIALVALLNRKPESFEGIMTTSWGALYMGLFFSFVIRLRELSSGMNIAFSFFLIIWATDTLAFFIGRRWGRHRLLPKISPGKTWEGTAAGTAAGILMGMGTAYWSGLTTLDGILFGLLVSISGQMGDLLESSIKRYSGVKDSGVLLPGHGGILDRFDSVLFALPIAYYLLRGLGIR